MSTKLKSAQQPQQASTPQTTQQPSQQILSKSRKITAEEKNKLEKEYSVIVEKCVKYLQTNSGTNIKQLAQMFEFDSFKPKISQRLKEHSKIGFETSGKELRYYYDQDAASKKDTEKRQIKDRLFKELEKNNQIRLTIFEEQNSEFNKQIIRQTINELKKQKRVVLTKDREITYIMSYLNEEDKTVLDFLSEKIGQEPRLLQDIKKQCVSRFPNYQVRKLNRIIKMLTDGTPRLIVQKICEGTHEDERSYGDIYVYFETNREQFEELRQRFNEERERFVSMFEEGEAVKVKDLSDFKFGYKQLIKYLNSEKGGREYEIETKDKEKYVKRVPDPLGPAKAQILALRNALKRTGCVDKLTQYLAYNNKLQQYGSTFQKFLNWYEKGDVNESRNE